MNKVIPNLPNEEYHHSAEYYEYWSSTGLRNYLKSPSEAKRIHDEHVVTEQTPAMALGSLVHDSLEYIHNTGDFSLSGFEQKLAIFEPPVNPTTGAEFGATTKKYQEAYRAFLATTDGKTIVSKENLNIVHAIARNVENDPTMSKQIIKGEAEYSHFVEHNGAKYKVRPDLLLKNIIFDYKTISGPLDVQNLQKRILDSMYHVQMSMYQWAIHEETGEWKVPYIFFMQTVAPYEVQVVNINAFCYSVVDGIMVNDETPGARQFEALRDLHERCIENDNWPGQSIFVKPDDHGRRILDLECPAWANSKIITPYYE